MANTGYKQATIAYRVSKPGGEPLDINGRLTSISGRKQAIALLIGYVNPAPSKYEVEFYFNTDGTVSGNPTITYDIQSCPAGYIRISKTQIAIGEPNVVDTFVLESSNRWSLISGPTSIVTFDYTAGGGGRFLVTATGHSIGEAVYTFRNELTKQEVSLTAVVSGYLTLLSADYAVINGVGATVSFTLRSSSEWELVSGPTDIIQLSATKGTAGDSVITATGLQIGQGYFTFKNIATKQVVRIHLACLTDRVWILDTGKWNNLGVWLDNGIWKYN